MIQKLKERVQDKLDGIDVFEIGGQTSQQTMKGARSYRRGVVVCEAAQAQDGGAAVFDEGGVESAGKNGDGVRGSLFSGRLGLEHSQHGDRSIPRPGSGTTKDYPLDGSDTVNSIKRGFATESPPYKKVEAFSIQSNVQANTGHVVEYLQPRQTAAAQRIYFGEFTINSGCGYRCAAELSEGTHQPQAGAFLHIFSPVASTESQNIQFARSNFVSSGLCFFF